MGQSVSFCLEDPARKRTTVTWGAVGLEVISWEKF